MDLILEVKNLFFGYGKKTFLKNINFDVKKGEMISVIGENGSGKSTLFKAANGNLKGYLGEILYRGKNIKTIKYKEKAKIIAAVYQDWVCSFPFSCFDVVAMGLYPHRGSMDLSEEDVLFIKEIMKKTDTINFAGKKVCEISGGQLQKVIIAKALAQKPEILFLDEAMAGLDISAGIKMTDLILKECKEKGISVVNIQHNINLAFSKSDRILALKNGEVYSFGTPEELLNKKFFREVFNVEVEIDSEKKDFRIIFE